MDTYIVALINNYDHSMQIVGSFTNEFEANKMVEDYKLVYDLFESIIQVKKYKIHHSNTKDIYKEWNYLEIEVPLKNIYEVRHSWVFTIESIKSLNVYKNYTSLQFNKDLNAVTMILSIPKLKNDNITESYIYKYINEELKDLTKLTEKRNNNL